MSKLEKIKKIGSATLIGEPREGGYYYLKSEDLPGFTFLVAPDEAQDIEKLTKALAPALSGFLVATFAAQDASQNAPRRATLPYIDLRGAKHHAPIIAEACFAL
jgi:hypothetical protein